MAWPRGWPPHPKREPAARHREGPAPPSAPPAPRRRSPNGHAPLLAVQAEPASCRSRNRSSPDGQDSRAANAPGPDGHSPTRVQAPLCPARRSHSLPSHGCRCAHTPSTPCRRTKRQVLPDVLPPARRCSRSPARTAHDAASSYPPSSSPPPEWRAPPLLPRHRLSPCRRTAAAAGRLPPSSISSWSVSSIRVCVK